ncbi:hypothetical protein Ancab_001049 [Ancistrocladus abbreviatus]
MTMESMVDEEVGSKRSGSKVVDATGAVGDVAEDEALVGAREGLEDVGENQGVHQEALGELEGHALGLGGEDAVDAPVDLEVVVGREERDGGIQCGITESKLSTLDVGGDCRWMTISAVLLSSFRLTFSLPPILLDDDLCCFVLHLSAYVLPLTNSHHRCCIRGATGERKEDICRESRWESFGERKWQRSPMHSAGQQGIRGKNYRVDHKEKEERGP